MLREGQEEVVQEGYANEDRFSLGFTKGQCQMKWEGWPDWNMDRRNWARNQVDYLTEEHVHSSLVHIYSISEIIKNWKAKG